MICQLNAMEYKWRSFLLNHSVISAGISAHGLNQQIAELDRHQSLLQHSTRGHTNSLDVGHICSIIVSLPRSQDAGVSAFPVAIPVCHFAEQLLQHLMPSHHCCSAPPCIQCALYICICDIVQVIKVWLLHTSTGRGLRILASGMQAFCKGFQP